jgi:glucose-6-phosphate 1-dehydrogenase
MPDDSLVPDPTLFVLFGATGDLSRRLVLPAFFRLASDGLLPEDWQLVGNGRGDVSHENFRQRVHDSLEEFGPKPEDGPWEDFRSRLRFAGGGFEASNPGSLLDVVAQAEAEIGGQPQRVHYLAVPPGAFGPVTKAIGEHRLDERARIVFEKPFGTSTDSFRELDRVAHSVFREGQIYRIDHFLGKEATQSIHIARFANGLFSGAWDHNHIESVQVDVPETLDVGMRASFYDSTGAILDMLVTHLFQLVAEAAMETPRSLDAEHIARAREEVIACFRTLTWDDAVVGQYEGYTEIDGVPRDSRTETFVAVRLWVDNRRWKGVPFLLRTGKCMAESHQRVSIRFREPPEALPGMPGGANTLSFELSGDGEIDLSLVTKKPGPTTDLATGNASLPFGVEFQARTLPAYARLIHDVLMGDRSLFTRPDGLSHVWQVSEALLRDKPQPITYQRGSWGPPEASALAGADGWILGG